MKPLFTLIISITIVLIGEYVLFQSLQMPALIEAIVMTQSGQVIVELWKEERREHLLSVSS